MKIIKPSTLLLISLAVLPFFGFGFSWQSYECGAIAGVPGDFVLMERQYHPIPSEYYRKLVWRRPEGSHEFQLTADTGGINAIEFELIEVRSPKLGTLKILRESEGVEIELGRFPESLPEDSPKRVSRKVGGYKRGASPACQFS